ncbi:lipoma HMGIC fusion partner-like 2 protein [Acanthaster planci]|uniref:Lipoma HMGIC fusion partner-like 2 protein n=1 Tax=Acanthaster planci TaxID=133434 RepID=A0A8B7XX92_ACAPL|nr:lipoma HMGIC fusion partner-like 2 protein [Acanthaster planci]XP_022084660.1 lipoma HMGIC fusion partner-like 2 protein [Acanthaster planci]XP_022084668.1 lipoma HMGIC fusion partner-like 2 protein [Acanthaster planci]XP_022084677.1 lipoma HMGIC fusion partner-like 2 protein [Acanthaster planci]XP_022084686.1 lipoma HMGIC fusion partner-like 2 protein [Acanthaster planci]XP_022084694.1 lipoma HMGIC fusion partner-like 2 protein [Acanthaster planci]XP_022084703.1 lipoma HMGIC fusion partne
MGYLIVTLRSILWTVVSIGIVVMHVFAVINPDWLLRDDRSLTATLVSTTPEDAPSNTTGSSLRPDSYVSVTQSSAHGLLTLCRERYSPGGVLHYATGAAQECTWIASFFDLPIWLWMLTVVFYCLGLAILGFIAIVSIFTFCFRSICKKSIFTVSGLIQAIAGLLILLGLVVYPAGWGSDGVIELCGMDAAPFQLGACSLGWAFYVAVAATFLTFACSVLSVQAEIATSSDDVQDEILKGKYVICLP